MTDSAYGLWSLIVINTAIFIFFAFRFFKPGTARDWRTLVMFPIQRLVYLRLARREEHESSARFGDAWDRYAARTPAVVPRWRTKPGAPASKA